MGARKGMQSHTNVRGTGRERGRGREGGREVGRERGREGVRERGGFGDMVEGWARGCDKKAGWPFGCGVRVQGVAFRKVFQRYGSGVRVLPKGTNKCF